MGFKAFLKSKTVEEYLQARKDPELMNEITHRTSKEVASNAGKTFKSNTTAVAKASGQAVVGSGKALKSVADSMVASPEVTITEDEMIMDVPKPLKAKIVADNEKVTITHFGALNFMSGNNGDVVINYSTLAGINVVPVNLLKKGYIEFLIPGVTPVTDRLKLEEHSNVVQIMNLEDTKVFEDLRDFINEKKSKQNAPIQSAPISTADEILKFKDLLDTGVITEEEFQTKKTELLNK